MVQTSWSDATLRLAFYEGISSCMKRELASRELPDALEGMIQLSLRVDLRLTGSHAPIRDHQTEPTSSTFQMPPPASEAHSQGAGKPIQLGHTSLSSAEKERWLGEGLHFNS